ncbi:hypothetical protein RB653_008178 [Dictyostelium firmibasis]|uniref:FAD-binding domain-containing protein n=1 Tax=Dictyostelium firmibasis TaxID=79012 RepID=A0AAN7YQX7_9MYCE
MNNNINDNNNNNKNDNINNNNHQKYYDVLIVGCGPNGALLANFLGEMGVKTLVVELAQSFTQVPRAAHLDDEGLRILKRIGLEDEIIKQSFQLEVKFNKSFSSGNLTSIKPETTELNFPRSIFWFQPKFEESIRNGFLKRYSTFVDLVTHCRVVSIEKEKYEQENQEEENTLKLNNITIENLSTGEISTLKSKFIIGADGGNSFIRKNMGSKMEGSSSRQRWFVVDAKISEEHPPLPHYFQFICNPVRPALTLPIPPNHFRWEFLLNENENAEDFEKPEVLNPLLISHGADITKLEIIRKACYIFQNRIADNWYNGDSTLLIGDACHLVPPFLGMGISSGFRDVQNIAWKIDLYLKGLISNPQTLFSSYQLERQPNIENISEKASHAGDMVMITNRYKAFIRNLLLSTLLSFPAIEKLFHNKAGMKPPNVIKHGLIDSSSSLTIQQSSKNIIGHSIPQPIIKLINKQNTKQQLLQQQKEILLDEVLGTGFSCLFFNFNKKDINSKMISKLTSNQVFKILKTNFVQVVGNNQKYSKLFTPSSISSSIIIDDSKESLFKFIFNSNSSDQSLQPTIVLIRPDKFIFGVYQNVNLKSSKIISSVTSILNLNYNNGFIYDSIHSTTNTGSASESENSFNSHVQSGNSLGDISGDDDENNSDILEEFI